MCVTLVETQFYSHVVAKFCHKLYSTRAVNTEGVGGQMPPPPLLVDQLTLFQPGGGRLCLNITTSLLGFSDRPMGLHYIYSKSFPKASQDRTLYYSTILQGRAGFLEINLHISIYLKLSTSQMGVEG